MTFVFRAWRQIEGSHNLERVIYTDVERLWTLEDNARDIRWLRLVRRPDPQRKPEHIGLPLDELVYFELRDPFVQTSAPWPELIAAELERQESR